MRAAPFLLLLRRSRSETRRGLFGRAEFGSLRQAPQMRARAASNPRDAWLKAAATTRPDLAQGSKRDLLFVWSVGSGQHRHAAQHHSHIPAPRVWVAGKGGNGKVQLPGRAAKRRATREEARTPSGQIPGNHGGIPRAQVGGMQNRTEWRRNRQGRGGGYPRWKPTPPTVRSVAKWYYSDGEPMLAGPGSPPDRGRGSATAAAATTAARATESECGGEAANGGEPAGPRGGNPGPGASRRRPRRRSGGSVSDRPEPRPRQSDGSGGSDGQESECGSEAAEGGEPAGPSEGKPRRRGGGSVSGRPEPRPRQSDSRESERGSEAAEGGEPAGPSEGKPRRRRGGSVSGRPEPRPRQSDGSSGSDDHLSGGGNPGLEELLDRIDEQKRQI